MRLKLIVAFSLVLLALSACIKTTETSQRQPSFNQTTLPEMIVITGINRGEIKIDQDTQLKGIIVGKVIVSGGVYLRIDGTIDGDLILEEGSTVSLRGIVTGNITNRGGSLEILGMLKGSVTTEDSK
ncbi:MAG: polymer-forming cytoskeletal protein [Dehalococcoidales bacterium]|nr:polymer-forming cytoskeletal protein [Dehalococcoidales bacterium]